VSSGQVKQIKPNSMPGIFTHLEQSATSRHFSTISTDFQEVAEAIFVQPQFRLNFLLPTAATLFLA